MDLRQALLRQAKHESNVWRRLNADKFAIGHQLHYLQMVSEKLAKGYLTPPGTTAPLKHTHSSLVRFMQTAKFNPRIRKKLGFASRSAFNAYLDSLLPLATKVEGLAPAIAGDELPNPEYPWRDRSSGAVLVPAEFNFPDFKPTKPQFAKLIRFIEELLTDL